MVASLSLLFLLQASPAPVVEFTAPSGWVPVEAPPLKAFTPGGLAQGQVVLLLLWPTERLAGGRFDDWFRTKLAGPGETILQQSDTERRPINGLDVLTVTQRVRLPQGGDVVRLLYAIASSEHAAMAMMTANQDQLITSYAAPARGFLESLRFAAAQPGPAAAPPVTPAPSTGGTSVPPPGFDGNEPRGLFYRLQAGGGQMETRTLVFLPGRRVVRFHPLGGGDAIDLGRCNPDTCGSFRLEAGAIVIRWDNGMNDRRGFTRSGEGFTFDGDNYRPARELSAAEAAGTWSAGSVTAGLTFRSNGSFEWSGGSAATTLRGRYEIRGRTVLFRFDDGTARSYTLFAAGQGRPAGLISFDGTVYTRRNQSP